MEDQCRNKRVYHVTYKIDTYIELAKDYGIVFYMNDILTHVMVVSHISLVEMEMGQIGNRQTIYIGQDWDYPELYLAL
jgi:hypothetical protein